MQTNQTAASLLNSPKNPEGTDSSPTPSETPSNSGVASDPANAAAPATRRTRKPSIESQYFVVQPVVGSTAHLKMVTATYGSLEDALAEMQKKNITGDGFMAVRVVAVKGKASFSITEQRVTKLKIG